MAAANQTNIDPRVRRTRQLLQEALEKLLESNDFEKISVQDIAEAATVNRVTFYDHYLDKFALFECIVEKRFMELLKKRNVMFDGTCASALAGIILGVCDYLDCSSRLEKQNQKHIEPHLELAVIAVTRRMIVDGLKQHPSSPDVPMELTAATLSWAIFGAALEWVRTPDKSSSEEVLETIMLLVTPILLAVRPAS